MLTVRQKEQLTLLVGGSAWGFYNSERFPADSRFNFSELTLGSDLEVKALAAAVLSDACAVAEALSKGEPDKITIGPLVIQDSTGDPALAAQARLWCTAAARLSKEVERASRPAAGLRRLPAVRAAGKTGARPEPVFVLPKLARDFDGWSSLADRSDGGI